MRIEGHSPQTQPLQANQGVKDASKATESQPVAQVQTAQNQAAMSRDQFASAKNAAPEHTRGNSARLAWDKPRRSQRGRGDSMNSETRQAARQNVQPSRSDGAGPRAQEPRKEPTVGEKTYPGQKPGPEPSSGGGKPTVGEKWLPGQELGPKPGKPPQLDKPTVGEKWLPGQELGPKPGAGQHATAKLSDFEKATGRGGKLPKEPIPTPSGDGGQQPTQSGQRPEGPGRNLPLPNYP